MKDFLYKKTMQNRYRNGYRKALAFIAVVSSPLTSCISVSKTTSESYEYPTMVTEESSKMYFGNNGISGYYAADNYSNGSMFNCTWRRNNISFANGVMNMTCSKSNNGFDGAEYRSSRDTSYGYYSVRMKAASCSGVISSFFTYVGYPWDEIDIEFLGKDTTKVQFNYYTSGVGGHEKWYSLGYDASKEFHDYGFLWLEDSITWYVDGKAVHTATESIPVTTTKIMANVWNGKGETFDAWCGPLDESGLPATASYEWFAYQSI